MNKDSDDILREKLNALEFHDPDVENLRRNRKKFQKEKKEYYEAIKPSRIW